MSVPASKKTLLACAALVTPAAALADSHPLRFLETAYSLYNPDWEARENASGLTLRGSLPLTEHLRVNADFNWLETDPASLPAISVRGKPFKNWRSAGIGAFGDGPKNTIWTLDFNLAAVDIEGNTENGGSVMLGVRKSFGKLDAAIGAGYLDLAIEDSIIEFALAYEMAPRWSATARIRDYSEWDYTLYLIGVRWQPSRNQSVM